MKQIMSPVAIDLGATKTGFVSATYVSGEEPELHHYHGSVITIASSDITLSQMMRRQKRHQRRGYARFRMLRRLVYVILKDYFKVPESKLSLQHRIQIQSLVTRRGFSYQSAEESFGEFPEELTLADIAPYFPDISFREGRNIREEIERIISDGAFDPATLINYNESLLDIFDKERAGTKAEIKKEKDLLIKGLNIIRSIGEELFKADESGVRHRSRFFDEIRFDFNTYKELNDLLVQYKVNQHEFINILCHLNNLPLKPLRKYFNNPAYRENDLWDNSRFHKFFYRWVRSWHTEKESTKHEHKKEILKSLKNPRKEKSDGIYAIEMMKRMDPVYTIPPYEDQNNRKPPLCNNLRLNAESLDRNFPGWKESTAKLFFLDPMFKVYIKNNKIEGDAEVNEVIGLHVDAHGGKHTGNNQKRKNTNNLESLTIASLLLQRFLDRSMALDPWYLRDQIKQKNRLKKGEILLKGEKVLKVSEAYRQMTEALSESGALQFIRLCERYYAESDLAKRGGWVYRVASDRKKEVPDSHNDESLLFKCMVKTGSRNNNKEKDCASIFGVIFQSNGVPGFQEFLNFWNTEKIGRGSLKRKCENIEKTRKKYKELFDARLKRELWLSHKDPDRKLNESSKELLAAHESATEAALAFGKFFSHTSEQMKRYNNPFSMAQVYNIIGVTRSGFSSVCKSCNAEDMWRSLSEINNGEVHARATKLTADTGRPFDGQIHFLLKRIAIEIAREKVKHLKQYGLSASDSVKSPVIIEQNSFSFRHQLSILKEKSKKEQNRYLEAMKGLDDEFIEKSDRIKAASAGICPYTGKKIGSFGEIDHIIPRALSRNMSGTVYDSEMNLIYCSNEGNQNKGETLYTLKDLHKNYLLKVFQTDDRDAIRKGIQTTVEKLSVSGNRIVFDMLQLQEQRDLRHALFDEELRTLVFENLIGARTGRVNGTQIYFSKLLKEELRNAFARHFADISIEVMDKPVLMDFRKDNLGIYRSSLADGYQEYRKEEQQKDPSHIIERVS